MNNNQLLETLKDSFVKFLHTASGSNEKLKILHGKIAGDLQNILGDNYVVKSLGYGAGKEVKVAGRYLNKAVDITVLKDKKPIAGFAVKFVMQNYAQNSVNYFENMLGETANIRSCNIPYFQIFIIPEKLPYFKERKMFYKWEYFTQHNVDKYLTLSKDNTDQFFHTPTKTLIFVIKLPNISHPIHHKNDYINAFLEMDDLNIQLSSNDYGKFNSSVIYNDYKEFIGKNYIFH